MTILDLARLGALAGAAALALSTCAAAQEGMFAKDLFASMGLIPKERPNIDYRERAPLVLPPRMDLRDPADPKGVLAANPQWPNDPDVLAARRREADARTPVTETERRRLEKNPTLSIQDIRSGRRAGAGVSDEPVQRRGDNVRESTWVHPEQLRREGVKKDEALSSMEEPERRNLHEPPSGFRKPTMQVKRDFEVVRQEDEADPKVYMREQAKSRE
jgi:hypothetical protein